MNDKQNPVVSIILPAYNAEKYIGKTIESVLLQTHQDWELIVINDKSTDNTLDVVQKYAEQDNRIRIITLSKNAGGPAKPRNEGVALAHGKYVAFLDADDLWIEEKLEVQLSHMIDREYNFVSSGMILIDENTKELPQGNIIKRFWRYFKKKSSKCDLIKNRFIINSSVLVEKGLLSPFDESKDFQAVEDLCTWLKLLSMEEVKYNYVDLALVKYRILNTSISDRNSAYKQDSKANLCISKHILEYNDQESYNCFYSYIFKKYLKTKIKTMLRFGR